MKPRSDPSQYPITLGAQFRRNLPLYLCGTLLLAAQQFLMAMRDLYVKGAVDTLMVSKFREATYAALLMLSVSVGAAVVRVLSRVTVFTGGRNVEYELRAV